MMIEESTFPLLPGSIIEPYEIIKVLGTGGMGEVLLANDRELDRYVAIKVLHEAFSTRLENDTRFRHEARLLSRLNHPNLVVVYAFGRAHPGVHYMVMEYVEGQSLEAYLQERGPLSPELFCHVLTQVGSAVSEAHRHGIVHRDLKPANIFLTSRAHDPAFVKVFDFGLAVEEASAADDYLGTPSYLSPEQAEGADLDARSDIYALAITACELLTGALPFQARNAMGFVLAHSVGKPSMPSELRPDLQLPRAVDVIFSKALAKNPDDRFPDVDTFVSSLTTEIRRWAGLPDHPSSGTLYQSFDTESPTRHHTGYIPNETRTSPTLTDLPKLLKLPDEPLYGETRSVRSVSVLHLELQSDFLASAMAFEEYLECLAVVSAKVQQAIAPHGGLPLGVLSHDLDILFGLQHSEIGNAEQAVDAALALRSALSALRDDPTMPEAFELHFRLGIDAGRIALVHESLGSTIAQGEPLMEASRLSRAAEDGQLRVSYSVYRRVRGIYETRAIEGSERARIVRARKQLVRRLMAEKLHGISVEMIGRTAPLAQLRSALAGVNTLQQARVVCIRGPVGVGKSRLVSEFVKELDERSERYYYEVGYCSPGRRALPYAPFVGALRTRARILKEDDHEQARLKLQQFLRRFLGESEPRLEGMLASFLNISPLGKAGLLIDPEELSAKDTQRSLQLYGGIAELYRRIASTTPIVFFLEDAQWANPATLRLLEHLIELLEEQPVLFLITMRDDESPLLAQRNDVLRISLDPLSRASSEMLIRHMLRALVEIPGWLVRQVAWLAEGSPLIMEETVRDLITESRLIEVRDDGHWILNAATARPDEPLRLPDTVEQLFVRPIERLSTRLQQALEYAAVAGERFWPSQLSAISGGMVTSELLDELLERELLLELDGMVVDGEADLAFARHAVQLMVYRNIPSSRRRHLHRVVAQWLEAKASELEGRLDEQIGFHFREAGALHESLPYELKAARSARRAVALDSAVAHFGHCQQILEEMPLDVMSERERRNLAIEVGAELVHLHAVRGDLDRACSLADSLASSDDRPSAQHALARALLWKAWALARRGDYRKSEALHRHIFLRLERAPQPEIELAARASYAVVLMDLGEFARGARELEDALAATRLRTGSELARALWVRGRASRLKALTDAAEYNLREAAAVAEAASDVIMVLEVELELAALDFERGVWGEAAAGYQRALEKAEKLDVIWHKAVALMRLGSLESAQHNLTRGLGMLRRSEVLFEHMGSEEGSVECARLIAESLLLKGDVEASRKLAKSSLERARNLDAPYALGACHRTLARVTHALAGQGPGGLHRAAGVIRHLEASLKAFRRGSLVVEEATTCELQKQLLGGRS